MAATRVLTVRAELDNAVVVRPGDKLVVATHRPISVEHARLIVAELGVKLPGVEIVLADGVSALAVYRADDAEDGSKPEMSDAEFTRRFELWIRLNPQEFERWVARYNRIHGRQPIGR